MRERKLESNVFHSVVDWLTREDKIEAHVEEADQPVKFKLK